jgi:hypothetical protein
MRIGSRHEGVQRACLAFLIVVQACNGGRQDAGKGEAKGKGQGQGKDGKSGAGIGDVQVDTAKPKAADGKTQRVALDEGVLQASVPAGTYVFGSKTGESFRNPSNEIDAFEVKVKPFLIDRYPYPDQKGVEPVTGVTFEEARGLCEKQGKRLCTELEWETACKGFDNEQDPPGGVSAFGMEGLFSVFEWTDTPWLEPELPKPRGMVVRSNTPANLTGKPRCSGRTVRQPEKLASNLGFRCCQGEVNAVEAKLEPLKKPFEEVKDFPLDKFQLLVKSTPEMEKVSKDPQMFGQKDLDYVLLRREIDADKGYAGYIFTTSPVWWRPVRGEELLVMTGFSGERSFVLALYHLGGGKFKHASSLVLLESDVATVQLPIPLILVAGVDRTVINWAPCWNCSEGGSLYIDDKFDTEHTGDFLVHLSYRWGP